MDRREKSSRRVRLNTMQIVALGFFGVIFLGGVILWLPICNQKPIEFIDALFTSVTSVCVTGNRYTYRRNSTLCSGRW